MAFIKDLFDKTKPINRRIEKVITYETADNNLLKQEIQEYIVTNSIEQSIDLILDCLEKGM